MSEINVNFAELQQASDDLQAAAQKIQGELDDLESKIQKLIATWEGEAQESYHTAQREWDAEAAKMQETAAKMGMAVGAANEAFQAGEKKNAGRFGG
ncbi:early secretory antigenic target ESAT-6 [Saccharopolyspora antimicrobica]|uniref:ESAT-6-like protein n=1 Tax=Saccharopolyspora antimicrobica TaxID=455193 RepID=A0A1I5DH16_9PSEU|nr:WXG100 family type VII secretion target [Saccharopolyspora antimicrobica]RKT85118.1 early secretory antigenic target protein ESAT-6 [Saccharopolyspora antimicrobica]SFN98512.1 early secretory antigenic target ESAT-6 [Saccharopolyspora antimicrobica]